VLLKAELTGYIKESKNPHRGIDQQTCNIASCITELPLHGTIYADPEIPSITKKVPDAGLDRQRCNKVVSLGHRFDRHLIQRIIH